VSILFFEYILDNTVRKESIPSEASKHYDLLDGQWYPASPDNISPDESIYLKQMSELLEGTRARMRMVTVAVTTDFLRNWGEISRRWRSA
jgi:hypothetical protein